MPKKNFNLDSNLYPKPILEQWIEDFSDFSIILHEWWVEIDDENPQMVFDEFSNYCLLLINEKFA